MGVLHAMRERPCGQNRRYFGKEEFLSEDYSMKPEVTSVYGTLTLDFHKFKLAWDTKETLSLNKQDQIPTKQNIPHTRKQQQK